MDAIRRIPTSIRLLLVTVLTGMLIAMGAAQVRSTIVYMQSEAGASRVYEAHEANTGGKASPRLEQFKLGRKPFEHAVVLASGASPDCPRCLDAAAIAPSKPRAPPWTPRGPPVG